MATKKRRNDPPGRDHDPGRTASGRDGLPTGPTGRQIIVLRPGTQRETIESLYQVAGVKLASSADFADGAVTAHDLGGAQGVVLEHLDIAIIDADNAQIDALGTSAADLNGPILSIEPELYVVPFQQDDLDEWAAEPRVSAAGRDYLLGYADAVHGLVERLVGTADVAGYAGDVDPGVATTFADTSQLTWGIQAVRAQLSASSGSGIRVAVLDTGFDLTHPDFAGRSVVSRSFVPGQSVQDGHSHGTHCTGTACGPRSPLGTARRYGIAYASTILIGKVLSNSGSGQSGWVLAGVNWAIQNHAAVISMSLGSAVTRGETHSPAYEQAALAALNAGCLVVAAAGNSGDNPVGSPANCPSVMAVAALDQSLQRAPFSCIAVNPGGGEIDIAAPGVSVYSSAPMPTRYSYKSGTSMATPHVAGIAALLAQQTGLRGKALWQKLISSAQRLGLPAEHAGAGLVRAPVYLRLPKLTPIYRLPVPIIPRPVLRPSSLDDLEPVE